MKLPHHALNLKQILGLLAFITIFALPIFYITTAPVKKPPPPPEEQSANQDSRLVDEEGVEFHLHRRRDGADTAVYQNGYSVTFRRTSDGGFEYIKGRVDLLDSVLPSYCKHYGLPPISKHAEGH